MADPRTFDGDPYEVAHRSVAQALGTAALLATTIEWAALMARNAEMERELARGEDPNAAAFPESAQGRRYDSLAEEVAAMQRGLKTLARVAAFNPKKPLDTP